MPGIQAVFFCIARIAKAAALKLSLEHKSQLPFVMQLFLMQQRCENICRPISICIVQCPAERSVLRF